MLILRRTGQLHRRRFPIAAILDTGSGAVTVTPAPAIAVGTAPDPTVQAGSAVTVTPAAAIATASAVSPTVIFGAITVTPAAAVAAASARVVLLCGATTNGVLTVDPDNGRYFRNNAGIVLLSGFHTWQVSGADSSPDDPPATLDFDEFLTALTSRGLTFTKMWAMEQPKNWPNLTQYFAPLPWARTGPGNANDGKPKFDLDTWDQTYFDRMREWTIRLGNEGIYVVAQMFQGWHYTNKGYGNDPYAYHPFNGPNNINSVDGDTNNDDSGLESLDTASSVYSRQQAYVRKVIDTLNDLDNVIWEVANEVDYTTTALAWERAIAAYIKSYESGLAQQHPVGITKFWPGGDNADLFASDVEWTSTDEEYPTPDPDATDGSMVVIGDSDHWQGLTLEHEWTWQAFTRGMNVAYMDEWNGFTYGTDRRADADAQKIRNQLGYILTYAARMDLRYTTPQGSLVSTGYALARMTGLAKLIAYQPGSGAFTVNLTTVTGTWSIEWLRTGTGATSNGGTVAGGAVRTLTPPWSGEDVVAFLERTADTVTPSPATATASAIAPTVLIGGIAVTPAIASATGEAVAPTVILGAITITPAQAVAAGEAIAPTVILGAVIVAPDPASAAGEAVAPAVILGAVVVIPEPAASAGTAIDPTVILGALTITPAPAIAAGTAPDPAVQEGGAISVTPEPATAAGLAIAPTVTAGSPVTVAPEAATATAEATAPTVILGAVTVAPAPAIATGEAIDPTVEIGQGVIVPAPAIAVASAVAPTVILGAVTVTPSPATATGSAPNPTVVIGVILTAVTLTARRNFTLTSRRSFTLTFRR